MNICIYGASSNAIDPFYLEQTEELGKAIAQHKHSLVFGGGSTGLMGAAARGVAANQGKIFGVAPHFFNHDGILFDRCTELILTDTMRQRKQKMEELSDAFLVLPGGIGTFEEFFEIFTLKQLHRHWKPIVIWNLKNYYDPLIKMLEHTVDENFMKSACMEMYQVFTDLGSMLEYLENYHETMPENNDLR